MRMLSITLECFTFGVYGCVCVIVSLLSTSSVGEGSWWGFAPARGNARS
jgi:hypothetical protein